MGNCITWIKKNIIYPSSIFPLSLCPEEEEDENTLERTNIVVGERLSSFQTMKKEVIPLETQRIVGKDRNIRPQRRGYQEKKEIRKRVIEPRRMEYYNIQEQPVPRNQFYVQSKNPQHEHNFNNNSFYQPPPPISQPRTSTNKRKENDNNPNVFFRKKKPSDEFYREEKDEFYGEANSSSDDEFYGEEKDEFFGQNVKTDQTDQFYSQTNNSQFYSQNNNNNNNNNFNSDSYAGFFDEEEEEEEDVVEKDREMKPFGFRNHGNTCFLNSALQLLFAIPVFTEYCKNERKNDRKNSEIFQLLHGIGDPKSSRGNRNSSLKKFVKFCNRRNIIILGKQGDPSVFVNQFTKKSSMIRKPPFMNWKLIELKKCENCFDEDEWEKDFSVLDVDLARFSSTRNFFKYLEGSQKVFAKMECCMCEETTTSSSTMVAEKIPEYCILSLDRGQNIEKFMEVNQIVSYVEQKYVLKAACVQLGSTIRGGHYICYVKSDDGRHWWCCDDSHVYSVKKESFENTFLDSNSSSIGSKRIVMVLYVKASE